MDEHNVNKRNMAGILGWLAISLVINLLALVPMVLREKRQAKKGGFPLEWDDIIRYGWAIIIGSGVQGLVLQYFFEL